MAILPWYYYEIKLWLVLSKLCGSATITDILTQKVTEGPTTHLFEIKFQIFF
jgi:hypothetical protein